MVETHPERRDRGNDLSLSGKRGWGEGEQGAAAEPLLMVGFNRRFASQVQKIKSLLAGVTGPKALVMTVNAGAIPAEHWTRDPALGGGPAPIPLAEILSGRDTHWQKCPCVAGMLKQPGLGGGHPRTSRRRIVARAFSPIIGSCSISRVTITGW